MKQILIAILIAIIGLWGYSIYANGKRFKFPSEYDYTKSESIDPQYHNPLLLDEYLMLSQDIGEYARRQWRHEKIDVRQPDSQDDEEMAAADRYKRMIARADMLGTLLTQSAEWKSEGLTNDAVALKELGEAGAESFSDQIMSSVISAPLKRGDRSQTVMEFQKLLASKGFELKIDGIFDAETEAAVRSFQNKNGLFESGQIDGWMWNALKD